MNQLRPYLPYLYVLAALVAVHMLHALFVLLKMPKAAAWIGTNVPTIDRFLLSVVSSGPKMLPPGAAVALGTIDEVAKTHPGIADANALLRSWLKTLGFLSVVALLAGCSSLKDINTLHVAIDAANSIALTEQTVAPELSARCVAPMQALAAEDHATAGHDARVKALAKTCDPLIEAYDGVRRGRIEVAALVLRALADGGVTVGAVLAAAQRLTADASALIKEIAQP